MSKKRLIDTKFWDDAYTSNLDPIEKLLFLYCLTNPLTNIIGIYEIELRRIAFDTGIDKDTVIKIIERFSRDKKIFYLDGYIFIRNFIDYQNQGSEKIKSGIDRLKSELPENIKKCISDTLKGIDTLSGKNGIDRSGENPKVTGKPKKCNSESLKGIDTLSHYNTNYNSNLNSNSNLNFNLNPNPNLNSNLIEEEAKNFPAKAGLDSIDEIIEIFSSQYFQSKGREYISPGNKKNKYSGKDRKAAGMLLKFFKSKYPNETSEETLNRFFRFFQICFTVQDNFFKTNISLTLISSKLNEIIETIRSEKSAGDNGGNSKGFDFRRNSWFTGN